MEINIVATTCWLKNVGVWTCVLQQVCFTNQSSPAHSPLPQEFQGICKVSNSLLNTIFRESFCGESVPKIFKTPAKWKLFLKGKQAMFCFSPFPRHLQLPFSINQLCLNSPIPGCFPAVQGVRSHYCSQQTRVSFPWTILSELAPLGGKAVMRDEAENQQPFALVSEEWISFFNVYLASMFDMIKDTIWAIFSFIFTSNIKLS